MLAPAHVALHSRPFPQRPPPVTTPEFESFAAALEGQYALEREVGRGGMGIVYLARDLKLDRQVAIKTLPAHLAGDPQVRERFVREARTAAALSHPNIVPIHRADELAGQVFFVMGYVDGESVAQRIRREARLAPSETLRILRDVAHALGYAHARGVVHRDVKAENILLDAHDGRAVVTDFGIARLAEAAPLTATGQVLGTVYYLSPEQVAGERIDGRSDLYALGVVGFLALAGRFPFDAELASAVLVAHVTRAAPPLTSLAPEVPAAFAAVIDRCLAKDPAARYASGAELARALDAIEHDVAANEITSPNDRPALPARRPVLVSDTEARDVWRRAAELQADTGAAPAIATAAPRDAARDEARTSGYRLGDVRDAAREAGIATTAVDRALAEHGLAPAAPTSPAPVTVVDRSTRPLAWLSGGPTMITYEVVIDGEVSERDFDLFSDTIRRAVGEIGSVSAVGRSLTWHSLDMKQRRLQVSILVRRGRTTIHASESLKPLLGGLFGGVMGGVGGGAGGASVGAVAAATHSVVLGFASWGGVIVASYLAARGIYGRLVRSREQTLRALVEELAAQAQESVAAGRPAAHAHLPR